MSHIGGEGGEIGDTGRPGGHRTSSCGRGLGMWAELQGVVAHELVPLLGSEGGRGDLHLHAASFAGALRGRLVFLSLLEDFLEEALLLGL